jgi:hypothetical protein
MRQMGTDNPLASTPSLSSAGNFPDPAKSFLIRSSSAQLYDRSNLVRTFFSLALLCYTPMRKDEADKQ